MQRFLSRMETAVLFFFVFFILIQGVTAAFSVAPPLAGVCAATTLPVVPPLTNARVHSVTRDQAPPFSTGTRTYCVLSLFSLSSGCESTPQCAAPAESITYSSRAPTSVNKPTARLYGGADEGISLPCQRAKKRLQPANKDPAYCTLLCLYPSNAFILRLRGLEKAERRM